jgi:hypothetical protein
LRDESNRSNTTTSSTSIDYKSGTRRQEPEQSIVSIAALQEDHHEATIAGVVREEVAGIPTIEGRDIEPRSTPTESTPTDLTVRAIVLQTKTRELYGSNVPAITTTNARIPLDSGATTVVTNARAFNPVSRCLLPEEAGIVAVAMDVEAETQLQLLLPPHQSLQEPVQS